MRLFTRLEISSENLPYNIDKVNWMDCFYKKDTESVQLYCFANVQTISKSTQEIQTKSLMLQKKEVPLDPLSTQRQERPAQMQVILELAQRESSIVKFSKNPLALDPEADITSRSILIYDNSSKENLRCLIDGAFDFAKAESYFLSCGQKQVVDLLGGRDFKDFYISKLVNTQEFLASYIRGRNSVQRFDDFIMAIRGSYGKLPLIKLKDNFLFAPIAGKKLFFVDQRSDADPIRGFLTPSLRYRLENPVTSIQDSLTVSE